MNRFLAMTGAALAVALPAALAQTPAAPQQPAAQSADPQQQAAPAQQVDPLLAALQGLQVAILENGQGGVASVESEAGDKAIIAFLTPQAAEVQRQNTDDDQMMVSIIDMPTVLANWNGAVIFRTSAEEVAKAKELDPDTPTYLAPVFFVMNGDMEAAMQTRQGVITPILTSYSDAESMAQKLQASDAVTEAVEIVPIEFAALLQAISEQETDTGYRVFTHPMTIAVINRMREQEAGQAQPQGQQGPPAQSNGG